IGHAFSRAAVRRSLGVSVSSAARPFRPTADASGLGTSAATTGQWCASQLHKRPVIDRVIWPRTRACEEISLVDSTSQIIVQHRLYITLEHFERKYYGPPKSADGVERDVQPVLNDYLAGRIN